MTIYIEKKKISINKEAPYLILEAGINHEGSLIRAFKMIDDAAKTKADAIKFQYFELDDFYLKNSEGYKSLKKMYLAKLDIDKLKKYSERKKLTFLCTAYSKNSFDFLNKIGVSAHKVSSMDNNNEDLLKHVAKFKKPIIFSTGMSNLQNTKDKIKLIYKYNKKIIILHCISNYPTLAKDLNLNNINFYNKIFKFPVGLSDHSENIFGMISSLDYQTTIIEKHFTFDKKRKGFDHNISVDYKDINFFYDLVEFKKNSLGKTFSKFERPDIKNQRLFRKGLYYKEDLKKNEYLTKEKIFEARPGINFEMINKIKSNKFYKLKKNITNLNTVKRKDFR
jgi:N,N'-diacetyllegionaminate synthase